MSAHVRPNLLQVRINGDVAVVTPTSFDGCEAEAIGRQLTRLIEESGYRKLHLDLSNVRLLDSLGLGTLVRLYRKVRAVGGEIRAYNVHPAVYEEFAITNLTLLFEVRRKEEETRTPLLASA